MRKQKERRRSRGSFIVHPRALIRDAALCLTEEQRALMWKLIDECTWQPGWQLSTRTGEEVWLDAGETFFGLKSFARRHRCEIWVVRRFRDRLLNLHWLSLRTPRAGGTAQITPALTPPLTPQIRGVSVLRWGRHRDIIWPNGEPNRGALTPPLTPPLTQSLTVLTSNNKQDQTRGGGAHAQAVAPTRPPLVLVDLPPQLSFLPPPPPVAPPSEAVRQVLAAWGAVHAEMRGGAAYVPGAADEGRDRVAAERLALRFLGIENQLDDRMRRALASTHWPRVSTLWEFDRFAAQFAPSPEEVREQKVEARRAREEQRRREASEQLRQEALANRGNEG